MVLEQLVEVKIMEEVYMAKDIYVHRVPIDGIWISISRTSNPQGVLGDVFM